MMACKPLDRWLVGVTDSGDVRYRTRECAFQVVWRGRHKVSPRLSTGELMNTFAAITGMRAGE
jgi:hypothetical protein